MSLSKGLIFSIGILGLLYVVTGSPYVVTFDEFGHNTVAPTTGRPLLGARPCTRGPAYWCFNITQAKECGAVHHCIQKVWEPMKLPADNDSVCEVCKEMVKEARDQLLSNETQDELRQVLEGSCKLIPLKPISDECCKLADNFIPELVDALVSRMDPQVVCAISGLCNNVKIDEMLGEMKELESRNDPKKFDLKQDACPKCNYYVNRAVTWIKSLNKDDLQMKIFEACGHLGSYSDSCRGIAMQELDTIYNYVQTQLNSEEICGFVGMCEVVSIHPVKIQSSVTYARVWNPPTAHDFQCDFCKELVQYLKNWFTSGTSKEEFEKVVEGLCKQTGKYRQECLNLAHEYGGQVYDYIINSLNPEEACEFLESCNSTKVGRVKLFTSETKPSPVWTILGTDDTPLTKLTPADKMTGDDEKNSHRPGFTYPMMEIQPAEILTGDDEANAHKLNPEFCELCKVMAAETKKYIKDNENVTDEEIKKWLYKLCDVVHGARGKICHEIVKRYGDEFVEAMINDLDPEVACPAIGLCPKELELTSSVPKKVDDILPTCALCTFTVTKLVDLIGKNKSKEAIDKAVDEVCYALPSHYKDECLTFMKEYGEKVAEMIVIEGSAHSICVLLHMCFAVENKPIEPTLTGETILPFDRYIPQTMVDEEIKDMNLDGRVEKKPLCAICEFVMNELDQMLERNATEEEIVAKVEGICKRLPSTLKGQCENFINEYGEMIVDYLVQRLDPREVCTEIHLCISKQYIEDVISLAEVDHCELCMLISDYLSAFMDDPSVETSIEKLVEKVCPLLPANRRVECKNLIEDYGGYLMSLLAQATDKGKACQAVNLCPARL